jgi:hypothetical protein
MQPVKCVHIPRQTRATFAVTTPGPTQRDEVTLAAWAEGPENRASGRCPCGERVCGDVN